MGRHLRRVARRAGVCLVLGVITTVAAAWVLALGLPHSGLTRRFNAIRPAEDDRFGMIWVREFSRPGMIRREWRFDPISSGGGATRLPELRQEVVREQKADAAASYRWGDLRAVVESPERRGEMPAAVEDARGWPLPAFWCGLTLSGAPGTAGLAVSGGVAAEDFSGSGPVLAHFRALPFRPIPMWLGIDAAFWMGAWLIAWEAWWQGRRAARRRRGRCDECGYELGAIGGRGAVCPECGPA